jgi:hypothetical protein
MMKLTWFFLGCCLLGGGANALGSATNFFTGFESGEGYSLSAPLAGTQGWVGLLTESGQVINAGPDGNGITNSLLPTQQAYVGLNPLPGSYTNLSLWHTLNPVAASATNVTFSTSMEIDYGSGGVSSFSYDKFLWKVCNAQSNLLFALCFDVASDDISYWLSASNAWYSAGTFDPLVPYNLAITMNPAGNVWKVALNGTDQVGSQPMGASGVSLSIGYIAAAWELATAGEPGDNYMVFDDYLVTSDAPASQPSPPRPVLAVRNVASLPVIRLTGSNGYRFALDARTNSATPNWVALVTNTVTTNSFDYPDSGAAGLGSRYYRGRWVP